eukprot:5356756-Prorocentrum_lima.AAC.1
MPATEALPPLDKGAPGLVQADRTSQVTSAPAASSSSGMASSSMIVPRPTKTKLTAAEDAEARERSITGWAALRP